MPNLLTLLIEIFGNLLKHTALIESNEKECA